MEAKEEFMRKAIELAKEAAKKGNHAVGAVIVKDNRVISFGEEMIKNKNDPILHAEIVAIRNACKKLNSYKLEGCILYSTHEPCPMCAAAAIWARMKGIVFGAAIQDAIKNRTNKKLPWRQINIPCGEVLEKGEPKLELVEGFLKEECIKLFDLSR